MAKIHQHITRMTATQLVELIRNRELSPVEVVTEVIKAMDVLEPHLHAFCTRCDEQAIAEARRVERDIMAGREVGPLAGVPVGIKDLIATKGIRTVGGSYAYEHFIPDEDDVVVERLRKADAIILGKTNVSELGYVGGSHNPVFETTSNPWNPDMTSGGSSAGSAAAVAAGIGPIALGSDGGGSIRVPASFCGLVGVKASMGRVPLYPGCRDERYPGLSSWEHLEHIGPISRTVRDSALMLSVIAGPDPRDRHSLPAPNFDWIQSVEQRGLHGFKVAFSADFGYVAVDPEVSGIVKTAVSVFEHLGADVEAVNPGWEDPADAFWGLAALDTDLRGMREMVSNHRHRMNPSLVNFIMRDWTGEELTNAVVGRKALYNKMWKLMQKYDLLVTPTLTVPAFPAGTQGPEKVAGRLASSIDICSFTYPINMTGQPAATVPAGWTEKGLPVGLQIVGRHLDDPTVLKACAAFEEAQPWAHKWPKLVANVAT